MFYFHFKWQFDIYSEFKKMVTTGLTKLRIYQVRIAILALFVYIDLVRQITKTYLWLLLKDDNTSPLVPSG